MFMFMCVCVRARTFYRARRLHRLCAFSIYAHAATLKKCQRLGWRALAHTHTHASQYRVHRSPLGARAGAIHLTHTRTQAQCMYIVIKHVFNGYVMARYTHIYSYVLSAQRYGSFFACANMHKRSCCIIIRSTACLGRVRNVQKLSIYTHTQKHRSFHLLAVERHQSESRMSIVPTCFRKVAAIHTTSQV